MTLITAKNCGWAFIFLTHDKSQNSGKVSRFRVIAQYGSILVVVGKKMILVVGHKNPDSTVFVVH